MIQHEIIPPFTSLWVTMNTFTISIISILIYSARQIKNINYLKKISITIGIILLLRCIVTHPYQIINSKWVIESSLPLHLCGISSIVSSILLFKFNQSLYEFLILLGIPAAIQSLLTPEFTLGIDSFFLMISVHIVRK